jgi:hypothetical protein
MHEVCVMRAALHGCVATALILSSAAAAHAQQEVPGQVPIGAHGSAFELGLAGGFAQGFGATSAGVLNPGAGAAVDADLGWRASSNLAIGVWGHGAQLGVTGNQAPPAIPRSLYQAAAGLGGTWHFRPSAADLDPWVALGTGWRAQWFGYRGGPTYAEHGLELVRGRLGLDLRVSRSIAIGPVVGASMDAYLTQQLPSSGGWVAVTGRPLAGSFFAGLRGTLDVPLGGR